MAVVIMLVKLFQDMRAELFDLTPWHVPGSEGRELKDFLLKSNFHSISSPSSTTKPSGSDKLYMVKNQSRLVFNIQMFKPYIGKLVTFVLNAYIYSRYC